MASEVAAEARADYQDEGAVDSEDCAARAMRGNGDYGPYTRLWDPLLGCLPNEPGQRAAPALGGRDSVCDAYLTAVSDQP